MELPDFMNYANRFTANDFIDKISRIAKRAGAKLVYAAFILYYTLQSDKVSKTEKRLCSSRANLFSLFTSTFSVTDVTCSFLISYY